MAKKEEIRDWTAGTEGFIAEVLEIQEKEGFTAALAAYLNHALETDAANFRRAAQRRSRSTIKSKNIT